MHFKLKVVKKKYITIHINKTIIINMYYNIYEERYD